MSKKRIIKCKLLKDDKLFIMYARPDKDGTETIVSEDHQEQSHPDMRKALAGLRIHHALLLGLVKSSQVPNIRKYETDLVEHINISSFSISGKDDETGVIISAQIRTPFEKSTNVNTPLHTFEQGETNAYRYMPELIEDIAAVEKEAIAYLSGKVAEESQLSMTFDEDKVTKIKVAEPITDPSQVGEQIAEQFNPKDKKEKPERKRVPQSAKHKSGLA